MGKQKKDESCDLVRERENAGVPRGAKSGCKLEITKSNPPYSTSDFIPDFVFSTLQRFFGILGQPTIQSNRPLGKEGEAGGRKNEEGNK